MFNSHFDVILTHKSLLGLIFLEGGGLNTHIPPVATPLMAAGRCEIT